MAARRGDPGVAVSGLRCKIGTLGPLLKNIRETQTGREYYTKDHLERLCEFQARVPWNRADRPQKQLCSDLGHPKGCKTCTSCHFCRQKTDDLKTQCPCAVNKVRLSGGRGRGIWCGRCLEMRMGENVDEARANPDWTCPVCREICNCSGVNCFRFKHDLAPTAQLHFEAEHFGWDSVAHYLILTELHEGKALEMARLEVDERLRRKQLEAAQAAAEGATAGAAAAPGNAAARGSAPLDPAARRRANLRALLDRKLPKTARRAVAVEEEESEEEEEAPDDEAAGAGLTSRQRPSRRTAGAAGHSDAGEDGYSRRIAGLQQLSEDNSEDSFVVGDHSGEDLVSDASQERTRVHRDKKSEAVRSRQAACERAALATRRREQREQRAHALGGAALAAESPAAESPAEDSPAEDSPLRELRAGFMSEPPRPAAVPADAAGGMQRMQRGPSHVRRAAAADPALMVDLAGGGAVVNNCLLSERLPAAQAAPLHRARVLDEDMPAAAMPRIPFAAGLAPVHAGQLKQHQRSDKQHRHRDAALAGAPGASRKRRSSHGPHVRHRRSGQAAVGADGSDAGEDSDSGSDSESPSGTRRRTAPAGAVGLPRISLGHRRAAPGGRLRNADGGPSRAQGFGGDLDGCSDDSRPAVLALNPSIVPPHHPEYPENAPPHHGSRAAAPLCRVAAPAAADDEDEQQHVAPPVSRRASAFASLLADARAVQWSDLNEGQCVRTASADFVSKLAGFRRVKVTVEDEDDDDYATAAVVVAGSTAGGASSLRTPSDVEDAVEILLLLARHMPAARLREIVVRRIALVADAHALIDFGGSCLAARVHVISGTTLLLRRLLERKQCITVAADGLYDCLRLVANDCSVEWLSRNRTKVEQVGESNWLLDSALSGVADTIEQHFQRLDSQSLAAAVPALLRRELITELLADTDGKYGLELRNTALRLVHVAASKMPPEPAASSDAADSEEHLDALMDWIQAVRPAAELFKAVLPSISALLKLDCNARGVYVPAGMPAPPLPRASAFGSGCEGLERIFGEVLGTARRLKAGLSWWDVERHVLGTDASASFWHRHGPGVRLPAVRIWAAVIRVAPQHVTSRDECGMLLRAWIVSMADSEQACRGPARTAARHLTVALLSCPLAEALFGNVSQWRESFLKARDDHAAWLKDSSDAVKTVVVRAAAAPVASALRASVPSWALVLIDASKPRLADDRSYRREFMLSRIAWNLTEELHRAPANANSALCRTLSRVNEVLKGLTRDGRRDMAYNQGRSLVAAYELFPDDVNIVRHALDFLTLTLEHEYTGRAEAHGTLDAFAEALIEGVNSDSGRFCRLLMCFVLPYYLRQAYKSTTHARAGIAAVRMLKWFFWQTPAERLKASLSLPLLLGPLLDALAPPLERGGVAPTTPAAVRAAVYNLVKYLVTRFPGAMRDALEHAGDHMVTAALDADKPLRTGAPLTQSLFDAAVGRLLVAALHDGACTVQLAAGGQAALQPPAGRLALDPRAASDRLRSALGLPQKFVVFEKEFLERRASTPALARGLPVEPCAKEDQRAACAALQLATAMAKRCGAAGMEAAQAVAAACNGAIQSAACDQSLREAYEKLAAVADADAMAEPSFAGPASAAPSATLCAAAAEHDAEPAAMQDDAEVLPAVGAAGADIAAMPEAAADHAGPAAMLEDAAVALPTAGGPAAAAKPPSVERLTIKAALERADAGEEFRCEIVALLDLREQPPPSAQPLTSDPTRKMVEPTFVDDTHPAGTRVRFLNQLSSKPGVVEQLLNFCHNVLKQKDHTAVLQLHVAVYKHRLHVWRPLLQVSDGDERKAAILSWVASTRSLPMAE